MHLAQSDVIPAAETHMVGVINAAFPSVTAPVILTLVLVLDLPFSWYCISWMYFFVEVQPFWPGCHQHNCENVSVAVGFLWPQQFYRVWRLEQKPGGGGLNQTCQICLGCIQWHLRKRYQGEWRKGGGGGIRMTSANDNTIKSALFRTSHINKNKIVT